MADNKQSNGTAFKVVVISSLVTIIVFQIITFISLWLISSYTSSAIEIFRVNQNDNFKTIEEQIQTLDSNQQKIVDSLK